MGGDQKNKFRVGYIDGSGSYPPKDIACSSKPRLTPDNSKINTKLNTDSGVWWKWDGSSYVPPTSDVLVTYQYQWYRGINKIKDEIADSYTTSQDDVNNEIYCKVTATINNLGIIGYPEQSNSVKVLDD